MIIDDDKKNIFLSKNDSLSQSNDNLSAEKEFGIKNVDKKSAAEIESEQNDIKAENEIEKNEVVKPAISVESKIFPELMNLAKSENKDISSKNPQLNKNDFTALQNNRDMSLADDKSKLNTANDENMKKHFSVNSQNDLEIVSDEVTDNAKQNGVTDFLSAIFSHNPIVVLMLGLGPALAVTTKLTNGIGLGIIVLLITLLSNMTISALRNFISTKIRLLFYFTIIGSVASVIVIFVKAFLPDLANSLGIFLPLTAVSSVIFERAENFACKKKIVSTILNSIGTGIGFMFVLVLISFIREFFGTLQLDFSDFGLGVYGFGKISIYGIPIYEYAKIFALPTGAFITLGILLAVKQAVQNHFNKDIEG